MRILLAMTYYRPYTSGPIVYAENLASALVDAGHEVTILTSQYDRRLPRRERVGRIAVCRVPVTARVSKGVLMPTYPATAARLVAQHDAVAIQVPQFEAPILAVIARARGIPTVMTYHCDVRLPAGAFNRIVDAVVLAGNAVSARIVDRVVAYTLDYAEHSPVMHRVARKVEVVPPPVALEPASDEAVARFRDRFGLGGRRVIGICARFATEKGFEHLLGAVERLLPDVPELCVVHAGEFEDVIGEAEYRARLAPVLDRLGDRWIRAGVLHGEDLAAFYRACDVTVLPSLNRTESFGFVQIESMLSGVPVVASALPGVRVPVTETGMGVLAAPGDTEDLAGALRRLLRDKTAFVRDRSEIQDRYAPSRAADAYVSMFGRIASERSDRRASRADARLVLGVHLAEVPAFRALIRSMEHRLFRDHGALAGPVLDIGVGDGQFAAAALGRLDVGIDIDADVLREAAARGAHRHLVAASATALPFRDGLFESALANCAIEHIPDVDGVVAEVHRVVRPRGRFLFSVPTETLNESLGGTRLLRALRLDRAAHAYATWFARIQRHEHMRSQEGWADLVRGHGFDVIEVTGYMGRRAAAIFDLAHYLGAPTLARRRLTGRWVPASARLRPALKAKVLSPFATGDAGPTATGCFVVAERCNEQRSAAR